MLTRRTAILNLGITNREAKQRNQRTEASGGYRFRVVPWRKKVSAFPQRLFFLKMIDHDNAGVSLRFSQDEMRRVRYAAGATGASVESWLLLTILDAVEKHEKEIQSDEGETK